MVVDGGTLEHVYDVPQAIRNILLMLRVGGIFLAESPVNGHAGHGCYQLSPEFYRMAFAYSGGRHSVCEMSVQTAGKVKLRELPLNDSDRSEWASLRPQCLLVAARKLDQVYTPPPCQADYASWIATGVNPTYRATPSWKRLILETFPFFSRWIEGWITALRRLL